MNFEEFFSGLDSLFAQKEIDAAEGYLINHLEMAKNCGSAPYQLVVLNEQVGYYRNLSRFAQSLIAGEQAMAIISAPDFVESITAATTMLNVATALRASGNISDALEMYSKVYEIYSATLEDSDPRQAALYNNMAQALMASGKIETALEYLHKSLVILEMSQGNGAELATNHSNVAVIYMSVGNNQAAKAHLQAAMFIFENLGYDDVHYPAVLAAMGQLMYIDGDYSGAVEHYSLAMNKTEAVFGQNVDYARVCRNCARAYSMLLMTAEAEALVCKAQTIEKQLGSATAQAKERIDEGT